MPGPRTFLQYVPVNAFSIVANPQAKVTFIVVNFGFDAAGLRVTDPVRLAALIETGSLAHIW